MPREAFAQLHQGAICVGHSFLTYSLTGSLTCPFFDLTITYRALMEQAQCQTPGHQGKEEAVELGVVEGTTLQPSSQQEDLQGRLHRGGDS